MVEASAEIQKDGRHQRHREGGRKWSLGQVSCLDSL